MKTACLTGQKQISVQTFPEPHIQAPDDVKIKVHYVSLCADEVAEFQHYRMNRIMGHEFSGVICDLGETAKANGFSVGDPVTGYTWRFCGKCAYCRKGKENVCINLHADGALQEYMVLKDRQICKILPGVSLQEASMFELVSSCVHGLERANLRMGDSVLILGGGGAGMIVLQLAKLRGATRITVSEPLANKRLLCQELGADYVVDPYTENLVMKGMKITEDMGYDCIIDASRNEEAVSDAVPLLARGGTLLLFSLYGTKSRMNLSLPMLYTKELTILTSYMAPHLQDQTMWLLPKLNLKLLLSKPFSLDEVQKAFETASISKYPRVFIQIASNE